MGKVGWKHTVDEQEANAEQVEVLKTKYRSKRKICLAAAIFMWNR